MQSHSVVPRTFSLSLCLFFTGSELVYFSRRMEISGVIADSGGMEISAVIADSGGMEISGVIADSFLDISATEEVTSEPAPILSSTPKKPVQKYQCSHCGKCYSQKRNACAHEKTHQRKEPVGKHVCGLCSKTFERPRDLYNHSKSVHTKLKPHKCNACGKSYASSRSLEASRHVCHKETIKTQKSYRCPWPSCGKTFTHKKYMRDHEKCHTGETRYRCERCLMNFKFREQVRRHLKKCFE